MLRRLSQLATLLLFGCSGSYLRVRVERAPDRKPIAGASVLLYDTNDDPCRDSPSGGQGTDEAGQAEVRAHYCGQTKLFVSAEGFEPVVRSLDTCGTRAVDVALAVAPNAAVSGGPELAAVSFVESILSADLPTLKGLLVDPESAELYQAGDLRHGGRPYGTRVKGVYPGPATAVETELLYDSGCRAVWRCLLKLEGAVWRVAELTPRPR